MRGAAGKQDTVSWQRWLNRQSAEMTGRCNDPTSCWRKNLSAGWVISRAGASGEAGIVTGHQEADEMIVNRCAERQDVWRTGETWGIHVQQHEHETRGERAAEDHVVRCRTQTGVRTKLTSARDNNYLDLTERCETNQELKYGDPSANRWFFSNVPPPTQRLLIKTKGAFWQIICLIDASVRRAIQRNPAEIFLSNFLAVYFTFACIITTGGKGGCRKPWLSSLTPHHKYLWRHLNNVIL